MKQAYQLKINETVQHITCESESLLIDLIRDEFRLTGTKCGCGIGVCGSCTVLIEGEAKLACRVKIKEIAMTTPAFAHSPTTGGEGHGKSVVTIEGLEKDGKLHPIQQAFIDCGAIQCGFCTPGMVLRAKALLDKNPKPSREEIKKALVGNLCRCTGYQQIFEAIETAAERMQK